MTFDDPIKLTIIQCTLEVSVPLRAEEWIKSGKTIDEVLRHGQEQVDDICAHGDVLLYVDKKKGETAAAFNALSRAVAACSFATGGIKIFGLHFQNDPKRLAQ